MEKSALTVFIMTAMLAGCCDVKTVYLPVSSCAEPAPFTIPALMTDNLLTTATTQDKLQALKIDHGTMRGSLEQCKVLLDAYRKQPPPQKKAE